MAYEQKPGQGSAFPNTRKTEAKHPDYTGTGLDLNGKKIKFAIWEKQSEKGTFFSIQISEDNYVRQERANTPSSNPRSHSKQDGPPEPDNLGDPDGLPF